MDNQRVAIKRNIDIIALFCALTLSLACISFSWIILYDLQRIPGYIVTTLVLLSSVIGSLVNIIMGMIIYKIIDRKITFGNE